MEEDLDPRSLDPLLNLEEATPEEQELYRTGQAIGRWLREGEYPENVVLIVLSR
jgi:hypothetical protein